MNILADASLPSVPEAFPAPFNLRFFHNPAEFENLLENQDILLCRSTLAINNRLPPHHLRIIATASSGIDHVDVDYLENNRIQLFHAKGSNAQAVTDYVLCTIAWLKEQHHLTSKRIGVIGCGAVGSLVATTLVRLGFDILQYDPLRADRDPQFVSCGLNELADCDLITIHANLHRQKPFSSWHLINEQFLKNFQGIILNAARGNIVDEDALLQHSLIYCTDVFAAEPAINPAIVDYAHLCTPHIAGHSIEAKVRAVFQLSAQIHRACSLRPLENPILPNRYTLDFRTKNWESRILDIYNPAIETDALKKAIDRQDAFSRLRKNHLFRHDFCYFF